MKSPSRTPCVLLSVLVRISKATQRAAWLVLVGAVLVQAARADEVEVADRGQEQPPSLGRKILWYVPNRVMDFLDIFRLRVRFGPGLAANVRATDYGAFYAGHYDSVYVGLPGPRYPHRVRSPVGRESLTGLILAGVDATDDTLHGPEYGASEFNAGVHLLVVGVEVGIDPLEIWDFLAGWFLLDPIRDDYPRAKPPDAHRATSGLSIGEGEGVFRVEPKPEQFESWGARLDYQEENVRRRIHEPLRAADAYFALDPDDILVPPQTRVRVKLFGEVMQGRDIELRFEPDIELDVEFPNIERRVRLFVETARSDEVHDRTLQESDERGVKIGARKWFEQLNVSADAGMRASWPPKSFARLTWVRDYEPETWRLRPMQRFVLNRDDRFASVSTLSVSRWLGADNGGIVVNTVSGKWTLEEPSWQWSEGIAVARVNRLLDESRRGRTTVWADTAWATGLRYTIFGEGDRLNTHRAGVSLRRPLYGQWVYGELQTGMEWDRDDDFDGSFFVRMGVDLLFWGTAREL